MISDLLIKLNSVEDTNKSLKEINEILQKEIEELKQIVSFRISQIGFYKIIASHGRAE